MNSQEYFLLLFMVMFTRYKLSAMLLVLDNVERCHKQLPHSHVCAHTHQRLFPPITRKIFFRQSKSV